MNCKNPFDLLDDDNEDMGDNEKKPIIKLVRFKRCRMRAGNEPKAAIISGLATHRQPDRH